MTTPQQPAQAPVPPPQPAAPPQQTPQQPPAYAPLPPAAPPYQGQTAPQPPQQFPPVPQQHAPAPQQGYQQQPQVQHAFAGAGQGWAQPPAGSMPGPTMYASPIPIRRTHLGNAIVSEWTKIKSVRSTVWTLGIMIGLVVGIGLLVAASTDDSDYFDTPTTIPGLFGTLLGQLCIVTLGVLVITSEYTTGMVRSTFTASPQRSRVLTAKALVFFLVSLVTTTGALAVVAFASTGMHSGPTVQEATGEELAGATIGAGLYVSLLGLLGLAVGSMLRHSAGAITAMLGVVLLPAIIPAFMVSDSLSTLRDKMLEYSAPNSLAALFQIDTDELGNGWSQVGVLAAVTAGALIMAYALLENRDV